MKIRLAAAVAVATALLSVTACGNSAPTGGTAPTAPAGEFKPIKTYPLCPANSPVYPCVSFEGDTGTGKLLAVHYARDFTELWPLCASKDSPACLWDTQTPGNPPPGPGIMRFVHNS